MSLLVWSVAGALDNSGAMNEEALFIHWHEDHNRPEARRCCAKPPMSVAWWCGGVVVTLPN